MTAQLTVVLVDMTSRDNMGKLVTRSWTFDYPSDEDINDVLESMKKGGLRFPGITDTWKHVSYSRDTGKVVLLMKNEDTKMTLDQIQLEVYCAFKTSADLYAS